MKGSSSSNATLRIIIIIETTTLQAVLAEVF